MAGNESVKAIYYALFANLGIAISKGAAAVITRSGSMVAETIHSLSDCANQGLLLLGMKRAAIPPDEEHPLGHGKAAYFWSFIVAMMLFSVGGLFSVYEGIHKLHAHEPVQKVWLALTVLGVSIILEMSSLFGALTEIKKIRGKKRFLEWLKSTRSSELVVVLGEDVAAVLGLIIAFVFVALSHISGDPIYDAIGSIAIGLILLIVSFFLIIRMKDLLIGKSADPEIETAIRRYLETDPMIETILNIITVQIGPYIMLAGKIRLKKGIEITEACRTINRMESNLKREIPQIRWSFMEPDII
jgi:cation diffusion facilitator family transporter